MGQVGGDVDDVLLRFVEGHGADLAAAAEHGRDLPALRIDFVDAGASPGRRDHRDLTVGEPADLPRLVLPRSENVLRPPAVCTHHEQPLVLEATRLADEGDSLAVWRPG